MRFPSAANMSVLRLPGNTLLLVIGGSTGDRLCVIAGVSEILALVRCYTA